MEIPSGWAPNKLGEVAKFSNGLNYKKGAHANTIKVVGVGDFQKLAEIDDFSSTSEVSVEKLPNKSNTLKSGDLLFVRSNGNKALVGRCLFLPVISEDIYFSGFTIRARVDKSVLRPKYAAYLAKSALFKEQLHKFTGGSSITSLSQNTLTEFSFPMPPVVEQDEVISILGTWDRAIAATEALIAKSEAQKKALMQQLLTAKRRLPGFEGDWKEVRLGDVVDIDWGNTSITKKQYVASGAQAYSAAGNDGFVLNAEHKKQGVVLSAIGARCGRCFLADGEWTAIKNTIVIFAQPNVSDNQFLFYLVNDARFWPISGGAQPFIGLKNAKRVKLMLPSFKEQKAIGEVFQTCSTQTVALQAKLQALKAEKAALMQQLLTGKRRVKLTDVAA